jgi:hypothetical protein
VGTFEVVQGEADNVELSVAAGKKGEKEKVCISIFSIAADL